MKKYTVAVVGATGVVGTEMIKILEEREFPVERLVPLASKNSVGKTVLFNGDNVPVEELTHDSFKGIDYALFSAGGSISAEFAPSAQKDGCVVIDNTSHFRMDPEIPLVVPEVNPHHLKDHKGIIANPNCSTAQLVLALKPIHDKYKIKRIVISTYQSVSGAGKEAITELENQTRRNLSGQDLTPEVFPYVIAFNVIPQIDVFQDNGYTKEEMKMILETKKILGDDSVEVTATCVRVPVFVGHSEAVNIQTELPFDIKEVQDLLAKSPGVELMDDPSNNIYPTPRDLSGQDPTYIGRVRKDISQENSLDMWIVSDNLRKGAALNTVQIAETLIAG